MQIKMALLMYLMTIKILRRSLIYMSMGSRSIY